MPSKPCRFPVGLQKIATNCFTRVKVNLYAPEEYLKTHMPHLAPTRLIYDSVKKGIVEKDRRVALFGALARHFGGALIESSPGRRRAGGLADDELGVDHQLVGG
jgi:hypothetical protein